VPTAVSTELSSPLELCYSSIGVYGKTFLPEAFNTPYSELHLDMHRLLDSSAQLIAIAAPRGLGKTTTVRALVERSILFRDYEFIPYVSNGETVATMQTENIKRSLRTNPLVRKTFGDIQISVDDPEVDESFSKSSWVAFGNTLVMPRGAGQQVRGLIYKTFRPQLIIVDDLEKKEELDNPTNRTKLKDWFFSDLMKCVDSYSKKWRIIYIDTLKHHDSLLQTLLDSPEWSSIRLDLCDDNYNSKVPHLKSTAELKREAEEHRAKGLLHVFYMEYRNMPIALEDKGFREEFFKYFNWQEIDRKRYEWVIIVDPAKTANMKSADSALVGIGVDYEKGDILIAEIVSGKMYPDELYEEMFAMRRRLNAHVVGVEVTGLEEFIKQPILNEMLKRGPVDTFEPIWLKARGGTAEEKGKLARIGTLVPYYRLGYIRHNKTNCAKLESQLLAFPKSALLDVADATAYIIELLELGERYFSTPPEENSNAESSHEDEFAGLEYDPPLTGWRIV
jgi:hypothetical protein